MRLNVRLPNVAYDGYIMYSKEKITIPVQGNMRDRFISQP